MSRIRGFMTDNNGFWIRWLDLLTFLYNYNKLWQLTIYYCLQLALFLTGPEVSTARNEKWWISPHTCDSCWMPYEESVMAEICWTELTSRWTEYRSLSQTVNCPPIITGMSVNICCLANELPLLLLFHLSSSVYRMLSQIVPSHYIISIINIYFDIFKTTGLIYLIKRCNFCCLGSTTT
jgi:hypothetical protein